MNEIASQSWKKEVRPYCFGRITFEDYQYELVQGFERAHECFGPFIQKEPPSLGLVCDVHRAIFQDLFPKAGKLRAEGVKSQFVFLKENLSDWLSPEYECSNSIDKAFRFEMRVEALAAFHEGMRRVRLFDAGTEDVATFVLNQMIARNFGQCFDISRNPEVYREALSGGLTNERCSKLAQLILNSSPARRELEALKFGDSKALENELGENHAPGKTTAESSRDLKTSASGEQVSKTEAKAPPTQSR